MLKSLHYGNGGGTLCSAGCMSTSHNPNLSIPRPVVSVSVCLSCVLRCSIDIPGMFEAKGVTGAKERLQLLVGDVRQPFPGPAQEAQVRTLGACWHGWCGRDCCLGGLTFSVLA